MRFHYFFIIAFLIFFSVNFLIYRNILPLYQKPQSRVLFTLFYFFIAFSYLIYRFSNGYLPLFISKSLGQIGSLWLGLMTFLFILFILLNLIQLFTFILSKNHLFPIINEIIVRKYLILGILWISILLTMIGFFNSCYPVVKKISINTNKNLPKPIKIVALSDLHLGDLFFPKHVSDLAKRINQLKPDIVLFVGDVLSEDNSLLKHEDIGNQFKAIQSTYGVYAVPGNHEYIGGIAKSLAYFQEHQIEVLRDSTIIRDHFIVVGRDDYSKNRFSSSPRKKLSELMIEDSKEIFTIVMDHQPLSLKEAQRYPVDLLISGHTHNGQIFPFNLITKSIFDNSWGLQIYNKLYYYVSCGYGFWGPPIRLGNRPEIILFEVSKIEE